MLAGSDRLESDEWDLHRAQQSEDEEGGVGRVQPGRVAAHQHQREDVQRDQVDDEDVATPGGHLSRRGPSGASAGHRGGGGGTHAMSDETDRHTTETHRPQTDTRGTHTWLVSVHTNLAPHEQRVAGETIKRQWDALASLAMTANRTKPGLLNNISQARYPNYGP